MTREVFSHIFNTIHDSIKGTKWENHVYLVGECVRKLIKHQDLPNLLEVVVDLSDGGSEFAKWFAQKLDIYKELTNPIIIKAHGVAKLRYWVEINGKKICVFIVFSQTRKEKYLSSASNPSLTFGTLAEDLARRGCTIDAIYYNVSTKRIYRHAMSHEDLEKGIIRTCSSDADFTIEDSIVRMMYFIRISTELGFGIDKKTWLAICKYAKHYKKIPIANVKAELDRIFLLEKPSGALRKLHHCGLLKRILPEVYAMMNVKQGKEHSNDVFEHTMDVVDASPRTSAHRLAALLHDIGKPSSIKNNLFGTSFYQHEIKGVPIAKKIMENFGYSADLIKKISSAIVNHERFANSKNISKKSVRKFLAEVDSDDVDFILDLIHANNICHSKRYQKENQVASIKRTIDLIMNAEEKRISEILLPVSGADLMDEFNLKSGPHIGYIIKELTNRASISPKITKEECLAYAKDIVIKEKFPTKS